MVSYK